MLPASLAFLLIAMVILLGFATSRWFETSRIPDIPILLSVGLVLGPLNRAFVGTPLHNPFLAATFDEATFRSFAPFMTQLALAVILFDTGLKLNLDQVARGLRPALLHTIPVMVLTVAAIAVLAVVVWGMPILLGVVLGVALSNVDQIVSNHLVRSSRFAPNTQSVYYIEMAIYDVISIPIVVGLLELVEHGTGDLAEGFLAPLARTVSISLLIGLAGGFFWVVMLLRMAKTPYVYMVTIAFLLFIYSVGTLAGGSGALVALIFGLMVGNANRVMRLFHRRVNADLNDERLLPIHDEVTFLLRSSFFIFLGLIFTIASPGVDGWHLATRIWPLDTLDGTSALLLVGVLTIVGAIIAARFIVVQTVSRRMDRHFESLWPIYGRGLDTAVLATFPFAVAAYDEPTSVYHQTFAPYETVFLDAALLTILFTVVATSVTFYLEDRRLQGLAKAQRS